MRTTVNIDEHLLAEAKQLAARTHRSVGAVMDDALRKLMADADVVRRRESEFKLPVDGRSGLQPGVDLEDKEALAELLGDNEWPRADP